MPTIASQVDDALWEHQRQALAVINSYLADPGPEAALISMPTGTGKSAVIAIAAAEVIHATGRSVLVLTPWVALVRQLSTDVDSRVWRRLGVARPDQLPAIAALPPASALEQLLNNDRPAVYVDTIAAIGAAMRWSQSSGVGLAEYFSSFAAVFVDEGHYEPAPKWSKAIRALGKPTVLLTATPYRNDEKFFAIGEHRFRWSHGSAVQSGLIREVSFRQLESMEPEQFIRELRAAVLETTPSDSRVIVRCESADRIQQCVRVLRAVGEDAIGIHHRFTENVDGFIDYVPDPATTTAKYWVHQYKLIEGIDDPRFRVIGFLDPIATDRGIVQQVGRSLRNPSRDPSDRTAWVMFSPTRDIQRIWSNYLGFDADADHDAVATYPELIEALVRHQPANVYLDGAFRTRPELDVPDAWRDFRFRLATRVFTSTVERELSELVDIIRDEWTDADRRLFATQHPDDSTCIIPYVEAENTDLLRSGVFIEARLGYTVVRQCGMRLFYWDIGGKVADIVRQEYAPLRSSELKRLLPSGSRVISVGLSNTDIGSQAVRSRTLRAHSVDALAPDLADYTYVCATAEGYANDGDGDFRRYVGIARSRVRDRRRTEGTFDAYREWLDSLDLQLENASTPGARALERYAAGSEKPDDTTPVHVLLDIDASSYISLTEDGAREPIAVSDTAAVVTNNQFAIEVNGAAFVCSLSWNALRNRYELTSGPLSAAGFFESSGEQREMTRALNEDQAFRIVVTGNRHVYVHGEFIEPLRPDSDVKRLWLLDALTGVDALESAASEKATIADGWDPDSVFGVINELSVAGSTRAPEMSELFPGMTMLLCTDLGTEVADFVAVQPDRVALVHAKSGNGSKRSASALHDVVGQAVKNLLYLQPANQRQPPTGVWGSDWSVDGAGPVKRLRLGTEANPADQWQLIRGTVTNPLADREVWLVLGASLSVAALRKEAGKKIPAPELVQIYALLQSAWSTCTQLGVRMRVFCSP